MTLLTSNVTNRSPEPVNAITDSVLSQQHRIETILTWVDRNSQKLLNGYAYGNETSKRILMNAARLRLLQSRSVKVVA